MNVIKLLWSPSLTIQWQKLYAKCLSHSFLPLFISIFYIEENWIFWQFKNVTLNGVFVIKLLRFISSSSSLSHEMLIRAQGPKPTGSCDFMANVFCYTVMHYKLNCSPSEIRLNLHRNKETGTRLVAMPWGHYFDTTCQWLKVNCIIEEANELSDIHVKWIFYFTACRPKSH